MAGATVQNRSVSDTVETLSIPLMHQIKVIAVFQPIIDSLTRERSALLRLTPRGAFQHRLHLRDNCGVTEKLSSLLQGNFVDEIGNRHHVIQSALGTPGTTPREKAVNAAAILRQRQRAKAV